MRSQPQRLLTAVMALCALGASPALAQKIDDAQRELTDVEAAAQLLMRTPLSHSELRSPTHVEERLTDGELFFRLQDYVRASVILSDIVDNYQGHPSYPDALFLLAESLFKAGDYFGARTRYRQIIEHADQA